MTCSVQVIDIPVQSEPLLSSLLWSRDNAFDQHQHHDNQHHYRCPSSAFRRREVKRDNMCEMSTRYVVSSHQMWIRTRLASGETGIRCRWTEWHPASNKSAVVDWLTLRANGSVCDCMSFIQLMIENENWMEWSRFAISHYIILSKVGAIITGINFISCPAEDV